MAASTLVAVPVIIFLHVCPRSNDLWASFRGGERVIAAAARAVLLPGFSGKEPPPALDAQFRAGLLGLCVYGDNAQDAQMLGEYVAAVRQIAPTALIAVNEEGGDVTRLHYWEGSPYPGNGVIGRLGQANLARQIGAQVGADLRARGFNFDIAPSVDVNSNPNNPLIGVRSFGSEVQIVAETSRAWISGLQGQGVAGCAKHFPGHGDTEVDSHIILTTLLREEMGFRGVIITDALDMEGAADPGGIPGACVRALDAGADMLCLGPASGIEVVESCVSAIVAAVARGDLAAQRSPRF